MTNPAISQSIITQLVKQEIAKEVDKITQEAIGILIGRLATIGERINSESVNLDYDVRNNEYIVRIKINPTLLLMRTAAK
jgi:hypothetical protein